MPGGGFLSGSTVRAGQPDRAHPGRHYTAGGFGPLQQQRLQQLVIELAARGALVLMSNSVAPEIGRLSEQSAEARSAGLETRTVAARRAINSQPTRWGASASTSSRTSAENFMAASFRVN